MPLPDVPAGPLRGRLTQREAAPEEETTDTDAEEQPEPEPTEEEEQSNLTVVWVRMGNTYGSAGTQR